MRFQDFEIVEQNALIRIGEEYLRAKEKFNKFNSAHEAYAVILEELNEFWHLVQNHDKEWAGPENMKAEIQAVGAMAMRFIIDM